MAVAFIEQPRGRYPVMVTAFKMTSGRFSPVYQVFDGSIGSGHMVHQPQFPAPGPDYGTEAEALHAGVDMAVAWMDEHLPG